MSQDQIERITDKLDEVKNTLSKEIKDIQMGCVAHSEKLKVLWEERSKRQDIGWKVIATLISISSVVIALYK